MKLNTQDKQDFGLECEKESKKETKKEKGRQEKKACDIRLLYIRLYAFLRNTHDQRVISFPLPFLCAGEKSVASFFIALVTLSRKKKRLLWHPSNKNKQT